MVFLICIFGVPSIGLCRTAISLSFTVRNSCAFCDDYRYFWLHSYTHTPHSQIVIIFIRRWILYASELIQISRYICVCNWRVNFKVKPEISVDQVWMDICIFCTLFIGNVYTWLSHSLRRTIVLWNNEIALSFIFIQYIYIYLKYSMCSESIEIKFVNWLVSFIQYTL